MNLAAEWLALVRREFTGYRVGTFQMDLLAGLTVAAVALPLALAFGVASGADAAAGLVTAIIAGVLLGILGGAPYQISGPTGAMSAVLIVLTARYGIEAVWIAGVLAGVIMMLALGILPAGKRRLAHSRARHCELLRHRLHHCLRSNRQRAGHQDAAGRERHRQKPSITLPALHPTGINHHHPCWPWR
ncbi:MAG: SulP family inorganic anion transporter [Caldilineaceae bacterium]